MQFISWLFAGIGKIFLSLWLAVAGLFAPHVATAPLPAPPKTASSTVAFFPAATSTPPEKPAPQKTAPKPAQVASGSPPPAVSPPAVSPDQVNADARAALVNILCITGGGGYLRPISGSGVLLDPRGIILTNAHVGQFFLLRDYPTPGNVDCEIRVGNPAQTRYHAELLYLPPAWVATNAAQIISPQPSGTGENDFAFLRITGTTSGDSLPSSFPYVPMTTAEPDTDDSVVLAAYPAGYIEGATIETSLFITSAFSTVAQLFSFGEQPNVDLFSIGGTVVSQEGSSGGAVVRLDNGKLAGIIATATPGDTTSARDLRAISLAHINRALNASGQGGIAALLQGDLAAKAATFNVSVAPGETAQLIAQLKK